jgi:hypothetical protein
VDHLLCFYLMGLIITTCPMFHRDIITVGKFIFYRDTGPAELANRLESGKIDV